MVCVLPLIAGGRAVAGKGVEIKCSACGCDALLLRTAQYDGFKKTGEKLACASCGHEYPSEEDVPFKLGHEARQIFTDADKAKQILLFHEDEKRRVCRYCRHYVVNPFVQRCGIHMGLVEATDSCGNFIAKDADKKT